MLRIEHVSQWTVLPQPPGRRACAGSQEDRIEIAWLDGNGSVQKTRSIDLDPTIRFTSSVQSHVEDKTLLVAWADSTDSIGMDPTLHVRRFEDTGKVRSADVKLSLAAQGKSGYLDGMAATLGPIVPAIGGARTSFVWKSGDLWFVGALFVCLASSP